jgi:hypothetical protein
LHNYITMEEEGRGKTEKNQEEENM